MNIQIILATVISILFSQQVIASDTSSYVLCKNKKVVRTIRIQEIQDGCVTTYTKAGVDKVVGQGQHLTSCQSFLDNIKGNLEEAAWKCRDISSAQLSFQSKKQ